VHYRANGKIKGPANRKKGRIIMINSRDISKLHPYVMELCNKLISECTRQGITIQVTSTLRDEEYQRFLFEEVPGSTNTPLVGAHGFGFAFDVVPIVNGKAVWGDNSLWTRIGAIGKALGLEWGGEWKSIVDKPHFQYTQGLSGSELRAGKMPKFPSIDKEGVDIMSYKLAPIAKGMLKGATSLTCCSKPSNNAKTPSVLKKGINEPINIYAKVKAEGIEWYLVNPTTEQWVAAHYIQII
jgi:peptidoglycan L-alanyl-D-glutamate endopeptidase CwlK